MTYVPPTAIGPESNPELTGEKPQTPPYVTFNSNIKSLTQFYALVSRGSQHFQDEMENNVRPKVREIYKQIEEVGAPGREDVTSKKIQLVQQISDLLLGPIDEFTRGVLTSHIWTPVILVSIVEAYLKDVRIFEAKVNPEIMDASEQSVSYADVMEAHSIEELTEEMQSRWARRFVEDGGPRRWIDRFTRMGAREYDPDCGDKMETLWGVRHLVVHSAGVVTRDFVRRHPDYGAKVGEQIKVGSNRLLEWIRTVGGFVEVTDSYFVNRYL